jgi:hypothetical protein
MKDIMGYLRKRLFTRREQQEASLTYADESAEERRQIRESLKRIEDEMIVLSRRYEDNSTNLSRRFEDNSTNLSRRYEDDSTALSRRYDDKDDSK